MHAQSKLNRQFKEVTGMVTWVTEPCTGVKIKGFPYWLNRPRLEFQDVPAPKRGQVWTFEYEEIEKADGDVARFIRTETYVETLTESVPDQRATLDSSPPPAQVEIPGRPSYEDAEWYWMIRDERGGVYAMTHQEYLASPAWRRRADLCLERDQYKCQAQLPGCTTSATQVHHMTYSHIGCEPVWDLQSVCGNCHTLLTSMDRKQPMTRKSGD